MYVADFHIHSLYSRATSKECDAPHLDLWARRKGIGLVGTGDFTHPAWRKSLAECLCPAEEGLYRLRKEARIPQEYPEGEDPRFIISGEISSIYKKNGKVRKVHNVILLPSLEAAQTLSSRLEAIGNLHSDGRPILGLDSRDLLEITLDACPDALFIPAHIWTPHFSLFGAFSGFDTIEECFGDLTPEIHALETGLSSDPPMNWKVSALDRFTLVSNSDAHSPQKLGREANLLDTALSYAAFQRAIETGEGFAGTLEFFPEEGKYHLDGHRSCGLRLEPEETARLGGRCPVCGKKLTVGVEHRVEELADRENPAQCPNQKHFERLVPLAGIVGGLLEQFPQSVKIQQAYTNLLRELGTEFSILRECSYGDLEQAAGPLLAEGIRRLRQGSVRWEAGYDGEYGHLRLFEPGEAEQFAGQQSLFGLVRQQKPSEKKQTLSKPQVRAILEAAQSAGPVALNPEQELAAETKAPVTAVIAGPGSGKTKTLVERVIRLLERGARPSQITAVTFTNLAAAQLRQRLEQRLGGKGAVRGMHIGTFHAICLELFPAKPLIEESKALELAGQILQETGSKRKPQEFLRAVSKYKNGMSLQKADLDEHLYQAYQQSLLENGLRDLDDLLLDALQQGPGRLKAFTHLLVDEFQDVSPLQYQLVMRWREAGESLFVIGDPDQAIYGFRGADSRCFARLKEDCPSCAEIRLRQNYRSTPQILSCALSVMDRSMQANQPEGQPVRLLQAKTSFEEGVFVAKEIARLAGGVDMLQAKAQDEKTYAFSEIAVLCRTRRQMEQLEKCLRHDSIPCVVAGREDYLLDEKVRGTLGFFRFLHDPNNFAALEDGLLLWWNCPKDLAQAAVRKLSILELEKRLELSSLRPALEEWTQLSPFVQAVETFLPKWKKGSAQAVLGEWMQGAGEEGLNKLLAMASFHKTMEELLKNLTTGEEGDLRRASGKQYRSGAVLLTTLHGAKGLEFPVVFLTGFSKGSIPLEAHSADWEEEKRLFYVGLTRAKEQLILTCPGEDSPFLAALPGEELERGNAGALRSREPQQLRLF